MKCRVKSLEVEKVLCEFSFQLCYVCNVRFSRFWSLEKIAGCKGHNTQEKKSADPIPKHNILAGDLETDKQTVSS